MIEISFDLRDAFGTHVHKYPITVEHDARVVQPITSCSPTTQALAEKLVLERFLNSWVLTYIKSLFIQGLVAFPLPGIHGFHAFSQFVNPLAQQVHIQPYAQQDHGRLGQRRQPFTQCGGIAGTGPWCRM